MLLTPEARPILHPKGISIDNPHSAGAENAKLFDTTVKLTVSHVRADIVGASTPSITWTLEYRSTRNGAGTTIATATTTDVANGSEPAITTATIPAGSIVVLVTSAQSGDVDELNVTMEFA